MRFNNDTRTRILIPEMKTSFDPAAATIELKIDEVWYPGEWTGAAVTGSGTWTRPARTVGYFAGPSAVASGATVLALGRHPTETRVTNGGDIIVAPCSTIEVR